MTQRKPTYRLLPRLFRKASLREEVRETITLQLLEVYFLKAKSHALSQRSMFLPYRGISHSLASRCKYVVWKMIFPPASFSEPHSQPFLLGYMLLCEGQVKALEGLPPWAFLTLQLTSFTVYVARYTCHSEHLPRSQRSVLCVEVLKICLFLLDEATGEQWL